MLTIGVADVTGNKTYPAMHPVHVSHDPVTLHWTTLDTVQAVTIAEVLIINVELHAQQYGYVERFVPLAA